MRISDWSSYVCSSDLEIMRAVAGRVEQGGVDVWYSLDPAELLGDEAKDYDRITDILDVWFDSGVTHETVLLERGLGKPADLYLEGSDQHRGWFQKPSITGTGVYSGRLDSTQALVHWSRAMTMTETTSQDSALGLGWRMGVLVILSYVVRVRLSSRAQRGICLAGCAIPHCVRNDTCMVDSIRTTSCPRPVLRCWTRSARTAADARHRCRRRHGDASSARTWPSSSHWRSR